MKKLLPQEILTWPNLPRLSVSVSIEEPLITPEDFKSMNILFITLGSMYNIPPKMTENMEYIAGTIFPLENNVSKKIFSLFLALSELFVWFRMKTYRNRNSKNILWGNFLVGVTSNNFFLLKIKISTLS